VAILGGGPSLTPEAVATVRGAGWPMIAINDAYEIAPDAAVLWWCDWRWYLKHQARPAFQAFAGRRACLEHPGVVADWKLIKTGKTGLERNPIGVRTGSNSGYQCVNLAVHLGARRIALLGIDMKVGPGGTHWHGGHGFHHDPAIYQSSMLPKWQTIAAPLAELGVEVVTVNPDSALTVFPRMSLAETLERWPRELW
jgi:hypothetical protein